MAVASTIIQRIVLPIVFTLCIICRPVALSIPYLLFLFYIPFVPLATTKTIRRHTGYYFKFVIAITTLIVLLQIAFQVVLLAEGSEFFKSCEFLENLFRHIGMIKLTKFAFLRICLWFAPDIVMLLSSIISFVVLRKLTAVPVSDDAEEANGKPGDAANEEDEECSGYTLQNYLMLKRAAILLAMASLLFAATLRPSIPSAIYFLFFLITATVWSLNKEIDRGFAIICRLLLFVLIVHIGALFAYQTPYPQEMFDANNTIIRFAGFSPLLLSSCNSTDGDIRVITLNSNVDTDAFLNPIALLVCYYTLAIASSFILDRKDPNESSDEPNERTPLMRRSMKRLKTFKQLRRGDSIPNDPNAIPLEEINGDGIVSTEEDVQPTIGEHIAFAIGNITDLVCKHSYVISNITMMVWSIVYHSWLTFVFLIVADLLSIIPNQRKNMHRISPFVVIYAELLLIAQYLYCMNLTESELPSHIDTEGLSLEQIGFIRYTSYPCIPLLLKTLFTMTFWLTLRQMKYEASLDRTTSTLAHLAAPFQVTVSAATTDLGPKPETKKSKIMMKAGAAFNSILLQLWIWIVVFALFFYAIIGEKMTVFRIAYMVLFLGFVITFQLSWLLWKKMLYGFWLVVIGFSMLTLIMVYTYQFNRIEEYLEKLLNIDIELQHDIGLVKYKTKSLFLNLFYPTFLVVITVVQLQIFHKKYLDQLDLPSLVNRENSDSGIRPASSVNYGSLEPESSSENIANQSQNRRSRLKFSDLKSLSAKQMLKFLFTLSDRTKWFFEIFWLFMEMHLIKLILIVAFLLGIYEVSVIHIAVMVLTTFAVTSRTNTQAIYSGVISLVIGIFLVLKMVYQMNFNQQSDFDSHCNSTNLNETTLMDNTTIVINDPTNNTANWIGFNKLVKGQTLMQLLENYIVYIVALTVYNIILLVQQRKRFLNGKSTSRPKVLFARITRNDADKDLPHLIKYLFNFGFYKFGVETTLVMIVILISARLDIIAILYTGWLCLLFSATRETKARIWPIFQWFIVALILIQYVLAVDLPPFLCFKYPWDKDNLIELKSLVWLPNSLLRNQVDRLRLDFILLMFTCRQLLVFRIEKQYDGVEFVGGSNKAVLEDINNMGSSTSPVPTHDFITFTRNWLDIIKCAVFLGFFWFTLAMVFLAGTNRVNIFSLGYLIGSFIFLWQGTDFYLRPIHVIMRWWGYLIFYNILVVTTKAVMHIPACAFVDDVKVYFENVCVLIKMLGIACTCKNTDPKAVPFDTQNEDNGLAWDCMCFVFLLLQLRIFQSYYFCHIINESKASTILASRGAELIESLRRTRVKIQEKNEKEILQKIKQKMDRIKATQQKLQTTSMIHSHELVATDERPSKAIVNHKQAVRSGDYYLFADLDEKIQLHLLSERASAAIADTITEKKLADKMTIEQVLSQKFHPKPKRTSETSCEGEVSSLPKQRKTSAVGKSSMDPKSEPITPSGNLIVVGSDTSPTPSPRGNFIPPDDEQPSTSRSAADRDEVDEDDPDNLSEPTTSSDDRPDSSAFAFITAFISGGLVSLTKCLYKYSRNYRHVTRVLAKEKKMLKEEKDFGQGNRIGTGRVWAPLPSVMRTQGPQSQLSEASTSSSAASSTQQITSDVEVHSKHGNVDEPVAEDGTTIAHLLKPQLFPTKEQRQPSEDDIRRTSIVLPEIRILAPSLERGLDESLSPKYERIETQEEHTSSVSLKDLSEDDDDFYSQQHSTLTEFCKSLWFALISNTDLLCYLLVFINMVASASLLALPIPLMVFLWGTLTVPRPSKTFWVSLIAYTQVVVLIKCVAQFDVWIDKNYNPISDKGPMAAARIIGIERKSNYATYDLYMLLVIFFHRFIQKKMGIWKTGYDDDNVTHVVNLPDTDIAKPTMTIEQEGPNAVQATDVNEENVNLVVQVTENEADTLDQRDTKYFPKVAVISSTKYCSPFTAFFARLLKLSNRVSADVYAYIFLCDFINFFVLLFGFTSFGGTQGDGGVQSYLEENKIPVTFLITLLIQFIFIIVDRALYLRKNLLGKILFQFISVIGMHIWLFILVPKFSERSFNTRTAPVVYYIFKCFYFLLSAYQIRCGYPKRILGNCLTKAFTMVNLAAFKVYLYTPFLFELRTLMDWIWTDSSMPLFEWLKMEDIYANIYELKCSRDKEKLNKTPRGQAEGSFSKYLTGGSFLIAIIALVWGPLALFALGNTVGRSNVPYEVRVSLRIGPYEPVYSMSAQSSQIHLFTPKLYNNLTLPYVKDRSAVTFLSNYESDDVAAVQLGSNSTSLWTISPPDLDRLKDDLINNVTLKVRYKYSVSRDTFSEKMAETVDGDQKIDLSPEARAGLIAMLNHETGVKRAQLSFLFPKFLKVKNLGDLKPVQQLFNWPGLPTGMYYRNLRLILYESGNDKWWEVLEECSDDFYKNTLSKLPFADCNSSSVLYTFSDKLFPNALSWLTSGGVIGIYTTFVFFAARFLRGFFSGGSSNIMYSELPFVDRILQLCLDIYLVRESQEFKLEEDLFAKLIFLYRSPETMIRWTRQAEEQSDDEDYASNIDDTEADNMQRKSGGKSKLK